MYKLIIKPLLFLFPPEQAHKIAFRTLSIVLSIPGCKLLFRKLFFQSYPVQCFGIEFPNPVGLAAGFDKNGQYIDLLYYLGFGFVEVGTVTPLPQSGNPKPRLFRLPQDEALINRMGFNNEGLDALVCRLKARKTPIIVGGNIGKNKVTPNEQAKEDYIKCFEALFNYVDYFVVNVSSPNTPGLRELQDRGPLTEILSTLQSLNTAKNQPKPLLLKIAPDLSTAQLNDIIEIVQETGITGIVSSNTTIGRAGLGTPATQIESIGAGGLSGKPILALADSVLSYLLDHLPKQTPVIAVGGIHKPEIARQKMNLGAQLVQIYTGYIYEGPAFVKRIVHAIRN